MIVGLYAKARAGKDSLGDCFKQRGLIKIAFANPLKALCINYGLLTEEELEDDKKDIIVPRLNKTPRQVLQHVGMSMREIDEDVWVNKALNHLDMDDSYVITDVRLPNELARLRSMGAYIIKLVKPGVSSVIGSEHETENSVVDTDDYDFLITNDGTLDDLDTKAKEVLSEIRSRTKA